jgi:hypothetical protein
MAPRVNILPRLRSSRLLKPLFDEVIGVLLSAIALNEERASMAILYEYKRLMRAASRGRRKRCASHLLAGFISDR